jgi:hypothetical protein
MMIFIEKNKRIELDDEGLISVLTFLLAVADRLNTLNKELQAKDKPKIFNSI